MNELKLNIPFSEISRALRDFRFPEVDLVVGIATGGIYPGILVAHQLQKEFRLIHIRYRDDSNQPQYENPVLVTTSLENVTKGSRILLVDEVSVTGKTMETAKNILRDFQVKTFVLKGKGDYVLFTGINSCVNWPWKAE